MPPAIVGAGAVAAAMGTAATATAVVVATAAINAAIYGAIIGAAMAAIKGGNILEGAIKGGVIGGITGGVLAGAGEGIAALSGATTDAAVSANAAIMSNGGDAAANMAAMGGDGMLEAAASGTDAGSGFMAESTSDGLISGAQTLPEVGAPGNEDQVTDLTGAQPAPGAPTDAVAKAADTAQKAATEGSGTIADAAKKAPTESLKDIFSYDREQRSKDRLYQAGIAAVGQGAAGLLNSDNASKQGESAMERLNREYELSGAQKAAMIAANRPSRVYKDFKIDAVKTPWDPHLQAFMNNNLQTA